MFALVDPLKTRLASIPALAGWDVRDADEEVSRKPVPAAEVDYESMRRGDRKPGAAVLVSSLSVRLICTNDATGRVALDAALLAVVSSVENWRPTGAALAYELASVDGPERNEQGQVGYRLVFESPARVTGQS